jgi:ABC-type antimicrobial peptide transport system permease subunit
LPEIRSELKKVDPAMPFSNVRTMSEYVSRSLVSRRAAMLLATSFGVISLFLAAIGIYGVLAYVVTQRSREIGIRIALGSSASGIFTLVLREGVLLVVSGIFLGAGGTLALRRVLQTQIYGVGAMDPVVTGVVVVTLTLIALAACCVPARRATQVDPVTVLSQQ